MPIEKQKSNVLTFEDFLELSRQALLEIPPKEFDEFGHVRIPEFSIIKNEEDREGLRTAVKTILERAKKAGIQCVVADGFSGHPAAKFFQWGWEHLYGKKSVPKLYSLGDMLVDTPGVVHVETVTERMGNLRIRGLSEGEGVEKVAKRVKNILPSILEYGDKPVLFISEFVDSGSTMRAIERVFRELGFTNMHFAALTVNVDKYRNPLSPETNSMLWVGERVSKEHHWFHPTIPWLHLRSGLYNELKKPREEQDKSVIQNYQQLIRQTYADLKKLAQQL